MISSRFYVRLAHNFPRKWDASITKSLIKYLNALFAFVVIEMRLNRTGLGFGRITPMHGNNGFERGSGNRVSQNRVSHRVSRKHIIKYLNSLIIALKFGVGCPFSVFEKCIARVSINFCPHFLGTCPILVT